MKFVSKANLELFAAELKKQGGSSKASDIDTESATAGQLLGTDGSGNTEWESPMTDDDVDMMFIEKGTILKMNLDGTERQYRVLKNVSGSVFEVLGMFIPLETNSVRYNTTSTTDTFADGSTGQKYAGSTLDTALNTTWYGTLSSDAKAAIVDKNITQDMWRRDNTLTPAYIGKFSTSSSYYVSIKDGATLAVGNRHVYAPSLQDIIDYLEVTPQMTSSNTTLTDANLQELVGTTDTVTFWLRTADKSLSDYAMVIEYLQAVNRESVTALRKAYPAFQIDLSKITYTEV